MAFDKDTRNELASLVTHCRRHLTDEFTKQCQSSYGIRADGSIVPIDELTHLSDHDLGTARQLRERITYLEANDAHATTEMAIDRMLREQAFTVMNRMAAMRMAEARGLIIESVSEGMESQGFEMYDMLGGAAMGERFDRYHSYLYSMFDELAIDLGVLFDRFSPHGLLFPRETALKEFFDLLNRKSMEDIWAEDETIGWIYQYWNSKEERIAMRDASPAPRNSRELAVRNQFFTPRYVVEFLTDNTLGRIWYEMTKGQTHLAEQCRYLVRRPTEIFLGEGEDAPEQEEQEGLSQEELLKQPVHIPHRPVKDPREIRLLDPACGSMHFGLYAFDLFEAIYEEAWDKGLCPALQEAYPEKADYLRDVPRLIIEHNIHGVDIDPRAVQIAGLSLWLRAQRTWKDAPAERPRIRRSNIVCAEPMPGSDAMLEDFVQTLGTPLLGELVKTVFDKMQLAGEAGTLLKIEEEIRTAIDEAKAKWKRSGEELPGLEADPASSGLRSLTSDFWNTAEERIYAALRDYAESAEAGGYQRRLFAEDAAHGFAFIDLCRKRYDAVVMNPPFGAPPKKAEVQKLLQKGYPKYKKNLACAFVYMAQRMSLSRARTGVICDRSLFFRKNYKALRLELLSGGHMEFADIGWEVMDDANVEGSAFCAELRSSNPNGQAVFFDLRATPTRADTLLKQTMVASRRISFGALRDYPNAAFAHWVVPSLIGAFNRFPKSAPEYFQASNGMSACDSPRFLRLWWEVPNSETGWKPLAHGGKFSPFIRPLYFAVNWKHNGAEVKQYIVQRYPYLDGDPGWVLKNEELFFKPGGLTYGKRAAALSCQAMPADTIFSDEGQSVFSSEGKSKLETIGFLNSRIVRYLINSYCGQHKHSGYLNVLPWLLTDELLSQLVARNASSGIQLHLEWERRTDPTYRDSIPSCYSEQSLKNCIRNEVVARVNDEISFLKEWLDVQSQIEIHAGLSESDRTEFVTACGGDPMSPFFSEGLAEDLAETDDQSGVAGGDDDDDAAASVVSLPKGHYGFSAGLALSVGVKLESLCSRIEKGDADAQTLEPRVSDFFDSYVGASFGRWDIRYATGDRQPPELPDPFDPLPVCPPGMLQNADGLPAAPSDVPEDYPLPITWSGILVDDEGHPEDIVARIRDALAVIWGDRSAAIEQEACEILGLKQLRDYFAEKKSGDKFFKDHLKRYSKSRRQAPIYWPLSTESGSYTLWIYYHRLDDQTLYSCIANFVVPKIEQIENDLSRLQKLQQAGQTDAQTSDEVAKLNDLLKELRNFQDELKRLAPIWKPNLNDGVQITAAPLWPLFRNKTWQKKLKETWTKLEKGDYDWAHLAYSIWPDRVREKCKKDKSLAIAHDLEQIYIEPPAKNKKRK